MFVHGAAAGTENLRRMLTDWLNDMKLVGAGSAGAIDRYIGYMRSYAESHEALDADEAVQEELRNVARSLVDAVRLQARGRFVQPGSELPDPRPK